MPKIKKYSCMTNTSSPSQRELLAAYEYIQDLVQEPSPADWEAWVRMGRRAAARLSELKGLWQDTNYHACTNPNI